MTTTLQRFIQLDAYLQTKGFPPTSEWWHEQIARWYRGEALQLVARVGRGGGKSSTICRLAVCEGLYGGHHVNKGDTGIICIVSASKKDANLRLDNIRDILLALGYAPIHKGAKVNELSFIETAEEIAIPHLRIAFRVYAASFRALSGFTSIFIFLDEVAKWADEKTGVSPARQVFASVSATRRAKPKKIAIISSPLGLIDMHADLFAEGDTPTQIVAQASTWVATNGYTTEAACRTQESNEVIFQREYGAIPQAENEYSLFDGTLIDAAARLFEFITPDPEHPIRTELLRVGYTKWIPPCPRHKYVATIDPATRGNAWTFIIATLSDNYVRRVVFAHEWRGTKGNPLKPNEIFAKIKVALKAYGTNILYSDQLAEDQNRALARAEGIVLYVDMPWVKLDDYREVRTLLQVGRLEIPEDPVVKTDLLGVIEKLTRNGLGIELARQGVRHSDYAPAIAMAALLAKQSPTPLPTQLTPAQARINRALAGVRQREREQVAAQWSGRPQIRFGRR